MIQRRTAEWSADAAVKTTDAISLKTLLELVVKRYGLTGAVVANLDGVVREKAGAGSVESASDGFEAALAGDAGSLKGLAEAIQGKPLPRYFSEGSRDAFADLPAPGLVAFFMRERGAGERSELQMVSDYNVAKDACEEIRSGIARLDLTEG